MLEAKKITNLEKIYCIFFNPGEVVEIRAFSLPDQNNFKTTFYTYVNREKTFRQAVKELEANRLFGIYFTLNPVKQDLSKVQKVLNKKPAIAQSGSVTGDKDIFCVRWLFIDLDTIRPKDMPSSEEELRKAFTTARLLEEWLRYNFNLVAGIKAMSGNGIHLLYRLPDTPPDKKIYQHLTISQVIKKALEAIAYHFPESITGVKVDTNVHNPARITKLYGTKVRKGKETPDRPYRRSYIINTAGETLADIPVNSLDSLIALAKEVPEKATPVNYKATTNAERYGWDYNYERFLHDQIQKVGIAITEVKEEETRILYVLSECLYKEDHTTPDGKKDAAIIIGKNNDTLPTYFCFHEHCNTKEKRSWWTLVEKLGGKEVLEKYRIRNEPTSTENGEDRKEKKKKQAEILAEIAEEVEFFHTPEREAYARIKIDDHYEIYPVRSKDFKYWLSYQFYLQKRKPPNSQALADTLNTLEGKALYEGKEASVFVRLAEHNGNIYLNLANDKWQVVEITPNGWQIIDDLPVFFRRPKGLLPLPIPEKDGNIELLKQFLNLETEEDWILTVAWLVYALKPGSGYPVLALCGEQGSAKSTFSKILKKIIDPSSAILKTTPKTERDLFISATTSWVLVFDNLSGIPNWLSDAFCRLSTGGGMTTRQLYSDKEETLFEASRPLIINGITDIVNRHDLADRCISITLPVIPDEKRINETKLFQELETVLPSILGGLLNAVSTALRNINHVKLDKLPRMADFAMFVVAAEEALPWQKGKFMEAYLNNRRNIIENAINADVVAITIYQWFEDKDHWEGTATDLLNELEKFLKDNGNREAIRLKHWPQDGASLGRKLRRIATFLRSLDINIVFKRTDASRKIFLERIRKKPSLPSYCHKANNDKDFQHDGKNDNDSIYRHPIQIPSSDKPANIKGNDRTDGTDGNFTFLSKKQKTDQGEYDFDDDDWVTI